MKKDIFKRGINLTEKSVSRYLLLLLVPLLYMLCSCTRGTPPVLKTGQVRLPHIIEKTDLKNGRTVFKPLSVNQSAPLSEQDIKLLKLIQEDRYGTLELVLMYIKITNKSGEVLLDNYAIFGEEEGPVHGGVLDIRFRDEKSVIPEDNIEMKLVAI